MNRLACLLIALAIIGSGCLLSPERKAQNAIKDYLLKNLDDPQSYESIEFSILLIDSTEFKDTQLGKKLSDTLFHTKFDYDLDSFAIIDCSINTYHKKVLEKNLKSIKITRQKFFEAQIAYDNEKIKFKRAFKGYIMSHSFRAKNVYGGYVKESAWFYLDKDFIVYEYLTY